MGRLRQNASPVADRGLRRAGLVSRPENSVVEVGTIQKHPTGPARWILGPHEVDGGDDGRREEECPSRCVVSQHLHAVTELIGFR